MRGCTVCFRGMRGRRGFEHGGLGGWSDLGGGLFGLFVFAVVCFICGR